MTWESKRQLRERLELTEREKDAAAAVLTKLGYQRVQIHEFPLYGGTSIEVNWRRRDGVDALTAEDTDRLLEVQESATRRETLTAVIEALGLKGYARGGYVPAGPTIFDTDRLWNEIQTTLRVRAERKQAEADAKTADKITGMVYAGETVHSKADIIANAKPWLPGVTSTVATATNDLAAKVNDLSARLDATETAKKDKK